MFARRDWKRAASRRGKPIATAELGVIAYETDGAGRRAAPGMQVNDGHRWRSCVRAAAIRCRSGGVGEIVVTALRGGFPLLRFATGDLSAFLDAGGA